MEEFKPGQVISPQTATPEPPVVPTPSPARVSEAVSQSEVPAPTDPTPPEVAPAPTPAAEPATSSGWQFKNEGSNTGNPVAAEFELPPEPVPTNSEELSWTAAEFIAHEKSAGWYGLLTLGTVIAATVVYLLTKDKLSTGTVVLAALALGAFAARKPKSQQYSVRPDGIQVGQKLYDFQDFKTFSVAEEGAVASVVFMPLKRFMPSLTIYLVPELEDQVVDFLSAYLPFEQHKTDAVDSLLRRIRF